MERLPPKPSTLRALFAKSGNECAFPGCVQPLVDDRQLLVAEVCHINAVKSEEARHDSAMTEDQLREYDNLILLCHAHHVRIDSLPDEYQAGDLRAMRNAHEKKVEHRIYAVSEDTLDDALFQLLSSDWEPYFEPTIDFLYDEIEEARGGQQGMNFWSAQVCELLDAALYIVTLKVLSGVTLSERRRLLREHQEWDDCRKREAHKASLEMEGGSGQPLIYNGTYGAITKGRLETLRQKQKC